MRFLIIILVFLINFSQSRTMCSMVIGKLKCPGSTKMVVNVKIELYDEDALPLESDDLMGRTWSNSTGHFQVTGCGSDFGPVNTPDPYLFIEHNCQHLNSNRTDPIQVDVIPLFLPSIVNLGNIYLDRYLDDPF